MNKLSKEEMTEIAVNIFEEMFPNQAEEDDYAQSIGESIMTGCLTAIVKFMEKYQEILDR